MKSLSETSFFAGENILSSTNVYEGKSSEKD